MALTFQNRATGGTASCNLTTEGGEGADKAFDQSNATKCNIQSLLFVTPAIVTYRFPGSNQYIVTSYVLTSGNDSPTRDPKDWTFQGSNDGSAWTTLDTRTSQTPSSRHRQKVYQFANTTAYEYYRINITANNGDVANTQFVELGLFSKDLSSLEVAYGGAANSLNEANSGGGDGGEKPGRAFDKVSAGGSTKWNDNKIADTNFWIQYDFGEQTTWKIYKYDFITANDSTERDPKAWTLKASNSGAFAGEEVTIDTVTDGALSDTRGASKTFTCATPSTTAYRYYRFIISDLKNLATANSIQLAEILLYSIVTNTNTFTVDGIIKAAITNTFTVDGIIKANTLNTFTVDGIVKVANTQTFTVDGIVKVNTLNTFTIDGIINATTINTFTVDGIIKTLSNLNTFIVDGIVKVATSQTFTADGIIKVLSNILTFTVDGIINAANINTFTADGIIKTLSNTNTFTVDAIIQVQSNTLTFTVDGIVKVANTQTFTVDGIVLTIITDTFTADGIIKVLSNLNTFTIDGIVRVSVLNTFTIDGIIRSGDILTFTVDGIVKVLNNLLIFTVDGIILNLNTSIFTIDGIILAGTTKTFIVDGIVKRIYYQSFNGVSIPSGWVQVGDSTWVYDGLTVEETVVGANDPNKLLYTDEEFTQERIVRASLKIKALGTGDERIGISVLSKSSDGIGVNLVIHYLSGQQILTFLDDGLSWGPTSQVITPIVGEIWWLKAKYEDGIFYGKTWKEGTAEPDWQIQWTRAKTSVYAYSGLVGNSLNLISRAAFDNFHIYTIGIDVTHFTVDGIVKVGNTQTFLIDGIVSENTLNIFTIDGIVKALDNTNTFVISGIIKEVASHAFTIDGLITASIFSTFTIDGIIFANNRAEFTIDGIIDFPGRSRLGASVRVGLYIDRPISLSRGSRSTSLHDTQKTPVLYNKESEKLDLFPG